MLKCVASRLLSACEQGGAEGTEADMAKILVTGGAGFIGSHTCVELLGHGHEVVILDHLGNSNRVVVDRIGEITGIKPAFVLGDVRDRDLVRNTLASGLMP
jgi:UDP-glucose 4-epimerase